MKQDNKKAKFLMSFFIPHPSSLIPSHGGFLSVALSRPLVVRAGEPEPLPVVGVTHRRALWSPDFPPPARRDEG
jgi:hypothetical protein